MKEPLRCKLLAHHNNSRPLSWPWASYTGRSIPESYAHLKLTDADFLAAGSDEEHEAPLLVAMGMTEFVCLAR